MTTPSRHIRETPLAEWIAAATGAVLIVVTLATLIHEAVTRESVPPALTAEIGVMTAGNGGYRVEFSVRNTGTRAAADVHVHGEILVNGTRVDEAEALMDYVAAASSAAGALLFARDPREGELVVRATGYRDP